MQFNSWLFIFFLLIVLPAYWALSYKKQNAFLLAASYIFYAVWDYRFCLLLASTTIVGFVCGKFIFAYLHDNRAKIFIAISVCWCLGTLAIFKYFGFFAFNLQQLFNHFGITLSPLFLTIVLPVGISFYNFHVISYTVDIYRKQYVPKNNFGEMALFVAFFPLLVAGPIERAKHLLPQISIARIFSFSNLKLGSWLIFWGLFKKIVIADNLAVIVNHNFSELGTIGFSVAYLTLIAFSIQIYCDFSGYTDIARGVSKLMGFELVPNFNFPYMATNPSDFWRRWHISLSSWLRDYLYIPLGGNRKGPILTNVNLMITMFLGGLWHGAAWNYIWWGIYHGGLLVGHRYLSSVIKIKTPRSVAIFFMYQLTLIGWMLFRCSSFGMVNGVWIDDSANQILLFLNAMTKGPIISTSIVQMALHILPYISILFAIEVIQINTKNIFAILYLPRWKLIPILGLLLFGIVRFGVQAGGTFIYFQF